MVSLPSRGVKANYSCPDPTHVQIGNQDYRVSPDGLLMPARKGQQPPSLKYFQ